MRISTTKPRMADIGYFSLTACAVAYAQDHHGVAIDPVANDPARHAD
jgi:hypothetical protein